MKNNKKKLMILGATIAVAVIAILIVAGLNRGKTVANNPGGEKIVESDTSVASLNADVTVLYPGDAEYSEHIKSSEYDVGNWRDDFMTLTADGDIVKSIMSYSVLTSNPRCVVSNNANGGVESEAIYMRASGPHIILNGFNVADGDFFAFSLPVGSGIEDSYVRYVISGAALQAAGLAPVEAGSQASGAEIVLGSDPGERMLINMSELEMDVSFTLLGYDEGTNTYSFSAVNNGPYGGTSDIFYSFYGGDRVKCFPTEYTASGHYTKYLPELCFVNHDEYNRYWRNNWLNRNELREKLNEKYGTHYPSLDYERDVEVRGDEYWSVIDPAGFALRQKQLAEAEEWYMSHPEALEKWRAEHPNWEEEDYDWDDPVIVLPQT